MKERSGAGSLSGSMRLPNGSGFGSRRPKKQRDPDPDPDQQHCLNYFSFLIKPSVPETMNSKISVRAGGYSQNQGYPWPYTMDEGTLKTPIPKFVFTGLFCLGWGNNFLGSESGQNQSVKLPQNIVYNTTQHPPPPPHSHTLCLYIMYM
jgi:hypothetical protein